MAITASPRARRRSAGPDRPHGDGPAPAVRRRVRFDRHVLPILLVVPLLAIIVGVVGFPVVRTFWLSFFTGRGLRTGAFVGLDNYAKLFTDPEFLAALLRTTLFAIVCVALTMVIALGVALVLDALPFGVRVLSVIVLLPWAMPRVASGIIWKWMFNDQYGVANWLLVQIGFSGMQGFSWFNAGFPALIAITVAVVWHSVPFIAISLLAGLRATRGEVIEAARVDGANNWQILVRIRLPMMKALIAISTIISVIWAYQSFDHFLVMTTPPGGPDHSTEVLSLLTWLKAFAELNQGAAAAMAVVTFVLLSGVTVIYLRLSREER
jgi:N,N'-diacetylchitobiose transport system permease protein